MNVPPADLPVEALLDEIETLAQALEAGDLPLEEALATFERGVTRVREARRLLDAAERRLEELLATTEDGPVTRDLTLEPDEADPA